MSGLLAAVLGALLITTGASAQVRAEVIIDLDQFGVGSVYRQGEVTGIRVRLTADPGGRLPEATMVWVQWEVPNADGDVGAYGRIVTLTRGRATPVWLYAPLPPDITLDTTWTVRVFEMSDGQRRGELGGMRFRAGDAMSRPEMVELNTGLMAVIGQRHLGLRAYGASYDQLDRPYAAHERTRVAFGIRPDQLPDRWEGLKGFEAVAWSNASPQELSTDAANALREYVRRGGHLIISVPEDINPWQFGVRGQTTLEDILPQTEPRKDEAVHISELTPVLSKARGTDADFTVGMRVFKEVRGSFDVLDNHYEPLIALPDGRVAVVQRTYGFGRITVSGIDLANQRMYEVPLSNNSRGMPQADAFWNRILGRRADTPTTNELERIREEKLLMRSSAATQNFGSGGLISQQIAMSTQAGLGLLMALMLFGTYWLLAGPGGFGLLKLYRQVKHAWLAFAATAGLFTAVAWGAVGLLKEREPQVRHLTVLDHVARLPGESRSGDPQQQRAVSWFELYIPTYGRPRISLDSEADRRNLLLPWAPPNESVQRFPNVDRYTVDVGASPDSYSIPARSTSTQMYANWLGGLDPEWGGMLRSHPDDPVRVVVDGAGNEQGLTGAIINDLPGTLRDVIIIWNRNTRLSPRQYARSDNEELAWVPPFNSGQMLNAGYFLRSSRWESGDVLDLRGLETGGQAILSRGIEERYVAAQRTTTGVPRPVTADTRKEFLEMLSFFHQLTPPEYLKTRADDSDTANRVVLNRHVARELDLSAWFSRPCLIIIGYLENSRMPVDLHMNDDNDAISSTGTTMVRWIYPLPLDERLAFPRPADD